MSAADAASRLIGDILVGDIGRQIPQMSADVELGGDQHEKIEQSNWLDQRENRDAKQRPGVARAGQAGRARCGVRHCQPPHLADAN